MLCFPRLEVAVRCFMYFGMAIGKSIRSHPRPICRLPRFLFTNDDNGRRVGEFKDRTLIGDFVTIWGEPIFWGVWKEFMLLQVCFFLCILTKQGNSLVKMGWELPLVLVCIPVKRQKPLLCIVHLCDASLLRFLFRSECCSGLFG